MKTKPILCPQRLRHVPRQFSWIDQRLVRHRHMQGRSADALALYLLLCTVADAQGISYYADATAAKLLSLDLEHLRAARAELLGAGLIAYRKPFYQVLSLDPQPVPSMTPPLPESRKGEVCSLGDVLRAMAAQTEEDPRP
jgi:hypothetical protein